MGQFSLVPFDWGSETGSGRQHSIQQCREPCLCRRLGISVAVAETAVHIHIMNSHTETHIMTSHSHTHTHTLFCSHPSLNILTAACTHRCTRSMHKATLCTHNKYTHACTLLLPLGGAQRRLGLAGLVRHCK